ncbi:MAG: imelysin family protein, partial [Mesorhizobium sp.]
MPVIAAGLCLVATSVAADTPEAGPIVSRVVADFIQPAYRDFHKATADLDAAVAKLCATPSHELLTEARREFGDTVAAWSRAEIIRFGPVTEQNQLERILFWPDRKSTGLKQVQAAIEKEDPTASDPATLAGKSVAMQGLG